MHGLHTGRGFVISNGTCHLQNTVVVPCRQTQALHGGAQEPAPCSIGLRMLPQQTTAHLGVAMNVVLLFETTCLQVPCSYHPLPDLGTAFTRCCSTQLLKSYRHHLHMQIDAVEQRT